jgi:hypothetical protein
MEALLNQLRREGHAVLDEDAARPSLLIHEHINMLGGYSFAVQSRSSSRGHLSGFYGIIA